MLNEGLLNAAVEWAEFCATAELSPGLKKVVEGLGPERIAWIFTYIAKAGFERWQPDLFVDADCGYNLLCERLALDIFVMGVQDNWFNFLGIVKSRATERSLLMKLYRSFVFSYQAKDARQEMNNPGSVMLRAVRQVCSRRRNKVCSRNIDSHPSCSDARS